jgi:glycerol-3-phosphate dehydrogenase
MNQSTAIPAGVEGHQFDLIVIGAGINGAGIARDAAMRGLDVLLVEQHDIGSGTTPWSTRLIHGGLRYLEHGELGLVRESLRERETLLRIAPHLVMPLPFLLPVYDWHRRGIRTIRAGMFAYDLLSLDKRLPRHQILSKDAAIAHAAGLSPVGLQGAALYYDAQVTFPERLALENVLDAVAFGATHITHTVASRVFINDGSVAGIELQTNGERYCALAGTVINAAGPWVDRVLAGLASRPLIGGTKGSHLVVARFAGAPSSALYAEARDDGRPFFIVPWQDWLLIGTTDTLFDGDPALAVPLAAEADYLLRQTTALFPDAELTRESVLFAYAGVRPLPVTGTRSAGAITRRHAIRHRPSVANGLYSIIGGKLTTYRSLAEQATDIACRRIGHGDRCQTADRPLPGVGLTIQHKQRLLDAGVAHATVKRVAALYGARSGKIAQVIERDPRLVAPLGDAAAVAAEIVFAVEQEFAVTIADVLLRRTMLGLRPDLGEELLEPAPASARDHLGWSESRLANERHGYRTEIERLRVQ